MSDSDPGAAVGKLVVRLLIDIDRLPPHGCRTRLAEAVRRANVLGDETGLILDRTEFGGHAARNWLHTAEYWRDGGRGPDLSSRSTTLGPRQAAIVGVRDLSDGELLPMLCAADQLGYTVDPVPVDGMVVIRVDIEVV